MDALVIYAVIVTMAVLSLAAYVLYLQDECKELANDLYRMKQARDRWIKLAQPTVAEFQKGA